MALLMVKESEPTTESEIFYFDAISALKQSSAIELKEEGNKYVKMGKKHFSDAIDCYTRAINQKALTDSDTSLLYSNRAHVNMLLGNYRRSLTDAEEAITLSPSNVKVGILSCRQSILSLNLLSEAKSFGEKGLELDSSNVELDKLVRQIGDLKLQRDNLEAEVNNAVAQAKELVSAFETRGLKMGVAIYRELTGLRKPLLDKNKLLHWPVLLLYAEVMSSDFIEDFCEIDMFSTHLDMMYSESYPPLDWDTENNYTREAIELYYEAGSGGRLPKTKVLKYLLEGTAGANLESEKDEKDSTEIVSGGKTHSRWVKVNEKRKLIDVMKEADFIIPGIPVFYVVSKSSKFYETFRSGKWKLP